MAPKPIRKSPTIFGWLVVAIGTSPAVLARRQPREKNPPNLIEWRRGAPFDQSFFDTPRIIRVFPSCMTSPFWFVIWKP
jgi:hypothetical protein